MKNAMKIGLVGLTSILSVFLLVPAGFGAQDDAQRTMSLQEVKDRLKENKAHLEDAKKRGKAGDAAGLDTALQNYDRNMDGINRAMNGGGFQGSEGQREEAFDRVEKATRKHGEVLAGLRDKVPEQARPAIERAMEKSQKGRQTALNNLQQVRTERQNREQAEMRRNEQAGGGLGSHDSMGRSGSMGGASNGAGGGMGAGRSAGAGGGASAGRGPR
jgi:hypothetical protein